MKSPAANQADERGEPVRESSVGDWNKSEQVRPAEPESPFSRRLLFLDDDPARAEVFLIENPQAIWVQTVPECLGRLVESWDEVHLDHDLGGKTFVDMNKNDCGMEVIRWLCMEPRDHLRQARFIVHTHNSLAGLLMVLQVRSMGYVAEFRPFGVDPARLLPGGDDEPPVDPEPHPEPQRHDGLAGTLQRWIGFLKGCWNFSQRQSR
jgi:hypothetical protein